MSNCNGNKGPIPPRWLNCPRRAITLVQNKFLAFKTPLSSSFNSQVPEACRFTVDMFFAFLKSERLKLGLWIDLTNTTRFYDERSVKKYQCKYVKLQCRGHGETPSTEQTKAFVKLCKNFILYNPLDIIGVHCTHGFNRTGFLIVSYLVEHDGTSVDAGLAAFAASRPPGIYKADYIQELYRRYDDVGDAPDPPVRPDWCLEYDDSNVEDTDEGPSTETEKPQRKRKREFQNKNPVFMAGVPGVTPILDEKKYSVVQRRVQRICSWHSTGFPGSQPVSMNENNITLLHEKPYRVSWKADGTRYMMLIQEDGEIYFIDRDNSVFQVDGLCFPHIDMQRNLKDTLLDGEMVIDKEVNGTQIPRYLVYDVIMYDGTNTSKLPFYPDRYCTIEKHIMGGRHRAMREGRLHKETEPFAVRLKSFWDVRMAGSLLGDKFAKQLGHEPDGLIFQPSKEPYCTGVSVEVLKWKPLSLNSVDFRLQIIEESGKGIVTKKFAGLYVGGLDKPFSTMKYTKEIKDLENSIIECKYENKQWVFMRERTDKSFPNSYNTARSVCESIIKPITTERLLSYIDEHAFLQTDSDLMPPPRRRL